MQYSCRMRDKYNGRYSYRTKKIMHFGNKANCCDVPLWHILEKNFSPTTQTQISTLTGWLFNDIITKLSMVIFWHENDNFRLYLSTEASLCAWQVALTALAAADA